MTNLTNWDSLSNVTNISKSDTFVINDVDDSSAVPTKEITLSIVQKSIFNVEKADAATYTVESGETIVLSEYTTTDTQTITIATSELGSGRVIIIKDGDGNASSNNITVATEGDETIDGAATGSIAADSGSLNLFSDGTNWYSF